MRTSTTIEVGFEVIGYHQWKDAPPHSSFLRNIHRHNFIVRVTFSVRHDDRDLEFFDASRLSQSFLLALYPTDNFGTQFGNDSCETIASKLLGCLLDESLPVTQVSVYEDAFNGATVRRS